MKKIPWTGIGVGCMILVVLVIGRCAVTAGRVLYYGGTDWKDKVLADPWFYVGMAASVVCVVAFLLSDMAKKRKKEKNETAGA